MRDIDEAKNLIRDAVIVAEAEVRVERGAPEYLFQYTNAKGLEGILTSKVLWATGFQFLNDRSEHIYGQELALKYLAGLNDPCARALTELWPVLPTLRAMPIRDSHPSIERKYYQKLFWGLQYFTYLLKDPSFRGETEWRIVSQESSKENFRVVGGTLIPYIEIPLEPYSVGHIVQGPGIYRAASSAVVQRFALSCGFKAITVKPSLVPLG